MVAYLRPLVSCTSVHGHPQAEKNDCRAMT